MLQQTTDEFRDQDNASVLKALQSDSHHGLDTREAGRRLEEYGPNEIEEHEEPLG